MATCHIGTCAAMPRINPRSRRVCRRIGRGIVGAREIMTQITRKWIVKRLIFLRRKQDVASKDLQSELAKEKGIPTLRLASSNPLVLFSVPYWGYPPNVKTSVIARRPVFHRVKRASRYAGTSLYESNFARRIVFYQSKTLPA